MLASELALVNRRPNLGYPWVRVEERNMMVLGVSPETSPSVSSHRSNVVPYASLTNERAPLTVGPICQSVCSLIFLIYFIDLNTCFKNSFLQIGLSNLSDFNFVSILKKCSIY